MDNSDQEQRYRQFDHLGVNKIGKNIKKSPSHNPNFTSPARNQAQPHVYNINRKDFREIVQQLTGSPSREPPPRPLENQSKASNNRLLRVRPPPLVPTRQPRTEPHPYSQLPVLAQAHPSVPNAYLPPTPTDIWTNPTESPISGYMKYLQNSIIDSRPQQPQFQPQVTVHNPNPVLPLVSSPRFNNPAAPNLQSPRFTACPSPLASPHVSGPQFCLPSPRICGSRAPLPSPTSQFLLPSPAGVWNLVSPRSPFPLLSPGFQHPPPVSPNFLFSPAFRPGILGPGPFPPPSPGYGFPLSPSGFPLFSPIWRF